MTTPCSTPTNDNFNCVIKASLELINLPLIDILAYHVKDVDLFNKINSCQTLLSGRNPLRTDQLKICFLTPPAKPDYRQFDVTLLYKLIRNLCPLLRPTQGWGNTPQTTDTKLGDDIERLRLFRNNYYAHGVSKTIPETEFETLWNDLKSVIRRIQSNCQTVCSVNYEQELEAIKNSKFTHDYLKKCEVLLEAFLILQTDERDEPEVVIEGKDEILCGDLARFVAVLKPDSSCWSITWQKRRGKVTETIDTSTKMFSGSTNRKLVIQSVCKEDEGEYQVLLSHESNQNGYLKCGNTICLHVFGEVPYLNDLEVTTGDEGIIIHYEITGQSPKVQRIDWKKDGQILNTNVWKYIGGSINDSSLTIRSPTEKDKGKYSCIITNAVGSVSKDVILDVPIVDIEVNPTVYFGSKATIRAVVSSTPPPEQVIWQKSKDGNNFYSIDITKPNYYGSNDIPSKPLLVIPKATFDDKLNYRLLVRNKTRESISETVHLNVTGSPPNITTSQETNIKCKLLKLIGNVSLYDDSPDILEVFWTKNGEKIDTRGSGGRLLGVTISRPSLIIKNVNVDDAGNYQLTAVNAVGSTTSDVIALDVPGVSFENTENKENGTQRYVVTIQSVPSPLFVQWSLKGKNEDVYTPIDCNEEDYKGTINTIPHPVLVVKKSHLEIYNYQIEVTNFFGCTVKQISDNQHHPTENVTKENKVYKVYKDRDAGIKFAKLSNYLAKHFPHQNFQSLKLILLASEKVQNVSALMSASSASECFSILHEENLFTQKDVIFMQFLCKETGCEELYSQCIKYALTNKALCFFEKPPDNGYKNVQFHVRGNLNDYTKEQIEHIVEAVADIVECETQEISVNGFKPSNSFFLVLSLKEVYTWKLSKLNEQDIHRLRNLNIDFFIVDFKTISLQSVRGRSPIGTTKKDNFPKCRKLQAFTAFCSNSTLSTQNKGKVLETDRDNKGKHFLDPNSSLEKRGSSKRDEKCQVDIGIDQPQDKPITSSDVQHLDTESSLKSPSISPVVGSMVDSAEVDIPYKGDDKTPTVKKSHENLAMVSDQRQFFKQKKSLWTRFGDFFVLHLNILIVVIKHLLRLFQLIA
nr:uncharacterized protein LOC105323062 [Crassostrea gigas]